MRNLGTTDGATEKVTPIQSADATDASTETAAVEATVTIVALEAVAAAPPEIHRPWPTQVDVAPAAT